MQYTGYNQIARLDLLFGNDAYAAASRIAHQFGVLVPEHVCVGSWRLGCYACQIDVAAALDEQFAIGQDLCLGRCQ